jgi:hypothetical protein
MGHTGPESKGAKHTHTKNVSYNVDIVSVV